MAATNKLKADIIKNALRRFGHLPKRTIARFVLHTYGEYFDGDLEGIRYLIRYYTGKTGKPLLDGLKDKSFLNLKHDVLPQTWRKKRVPYKLNEGVWLVLSDAHIPFHEQLPLEAAVEYGQAEKVTGILLNGDWQDCAAVSYWKVEHRNFHREIEAVIDSLDWLRQKFPTQEIVYKPGNHEYRLPRYYLSNAPQLIETPLAAMETVLGFEQRNIEYLDYHQIVMAGKLPVIHGHEVQSLSKTVNPARGLFLRAKTWAACSHCHQTSQHTTKDINGQIISTWSFGCLCDLSPDYNAIGNDWNWGFALISVEKNGHFEVQNLRILPSGKVV